jgi:oxygen-independent coproporphyrinogen-3 oxidase
MNENHDHNTGYGALYLHIPYCAQRCGYCDFTTEAIDPDDPQLDLYTEDLIREIRSAARDGLLGDIQTVYIGGGTPTFLGQRRLVNLVYTLSLSLNLRPDTEFTLEANPESLTKPLLRDLYSLGVSRLSLGVQSFNDEELRALRRIHNANRAREALADARERFENISIDLMCGIPLQTEETWQATLDEALASGITHVSVYPLTIEDGTPFARLVDNGTQTLPDGDLQATLMEQAARMFALAGFERYEVASYAKPGFACKHNSAYWTGVPYLGLGRGAAGMRQNSQGRERLFSSEVVEQLTPAQAALEDLMLGMRMSAGVSLSQVTQAAQHVPGIVATFEELALLQLIEVAKGRYRPTQRGWLLGNELFGRIWNTPG